MTLYTFQQIIWNVTYSSYECENLLWINNSKKFFSHRSMRESGGRCCLGRRAARATRPSCRIKVFDLLSISNQVNLVKPTLIKIIISTSDTILPVGLPVTLTSSGIRYMIASNMCFSNYNLSNNAKWINVLVDITENVSTQKFNLNFFVRGDRFRSLLLSSDRTYSQ